MSKVGDALRRAPAGLNQVIGECEATIRLLFRVAFVIVVYGGLRWIGNSIPGSPDTVGIALALDNIGWALDDIAAALPLR